MFPLSSHKNVSFESSINPKYEDYTECYEKYNSDKIKKTDIPINIKQFVISILNQVQIAHKERKNVENRFHHSIEDDEGLYARIAWSHDTKYDRVFSPDSLIFRIHNSSMLEKNIMLHVIESVTNETENQKFSKPAIIAMCLFFGIEEIHEYVNKNLDMKYKSEEELKNALSQSCKSKESLINAKIDDNIKKELLYDNQKKIFFIKEKLEMLNKSPEEMESKIFTSVQQDYIKNVGKEIKELSDEIDDLYLSEFLIKLEKKNTKILKKPKYIEECYLILMSFQLLEIRMQILQLKEKKSPYLKDNFFSLYNLDVKFNSFVANNEKSDLGELLMNKIKDKIRKIKKNVGFEKELFLTNFEQWTLDRLTDFENFSDNTDDSHEAGVLKHQLKIILGLT